MTHLRHPSLSTLLKSCKAPHHLRQLHSRIIKSGLEQHHILISQLLSRLCNSDLPYATSIFNRVTHPNSYLWNALLKGYCEKASTLDTILLFKRFRGLGLGEEEREGFGVDRYTFPSLMKACAGGMRVREGRMVHGAIVRCGVEADLYVETSLVDFYGKCGEIECARKVFDEMPERNEVSWTAMIVGCLNAGELGEARGLFDRMPRRVVGTWNAMIGGYVRFGELGNARRLFDEMGDRNVVSFTLMIDGYAKYGDMASARDLFERAPGKDVVAWSALISGYVQNGKPNEAVEIFMEMQAENVRPDEFILVNLMSACSQVGSLQLAKWVDGYVAWSSVDVNQAHVVAALIDMHAKCGNMERASDLFEKMKQRDLITYCSMIQGLSIHDCGIQAVQLFARMLEEKLIPDNVAFTVVLAACSRAGLIEEGCRYFHMMNDFSIAPSPDHYACMVSLLGRGGQLDAAYELIKSMPVEPHAGSWGALLDACGMHGNFELGKVVAGHLFELERQSASSYVLLSNIYAASNRWSDVIEMRERMRERGVRKIPGCSWI